MRRPEAEPPVPEPGQERRRERRRAAFRLGVSAEAHAVALLMVKGFRILARRYRSPAGEIDIVARRGRLLVFVEVKARATQDDAAWAVTPRQQARIVAAAGAWLAAHPEDAACFMRFDVILASPRALPQHVRNAFDAG